MGGLDMCKSSRCPADSLRTDSHRLWKMGYQQYVASSVQEGSSGREGNTYSSAGHPIADAHPGNIDAVVFPGQDYNNARIYDFEDVDKWENNKRARTQSGFLRTMLTELVDRTKCSRMGWSDISISLSGPILDSLAIHFTQRW